MIKRPIYVLLSVQEWILNAIIVAPETDKKELARGGAAR